MLSFYNLPIDAVSPAAIFVLTPSCYFVRAQDTRVYVSLSSTINHREHCHVKCILQIADAEVIFMSTDQHNVHIMSIE